MSNTYNDLPNTVFPDNLDKYKIYQDISLDNVAYVEQIQSDIAAHNFDDAKAVIAAHPELNNVMATAALFQRYEDQIIAIERTWSSTIYNKVTHVVKYKGDYSNVATYQMFNVVNYNNKSYQCISTDDITGILPTNTDNWQLLTIQGVSGTGMAFYTAWSSIQAYKVQDCVPFGNKLYVCITAHTNQTPSTSPDYWKQIIVVPRQIIWSKNQPESQESGDVWNKINDIDDSYETYVCQGNNDYVLKQPKSNANFISTSDGSNVQTKLNSLQSSVNEDNKITTYTCITTGTEHALTTANIGSNGKFYSDADFSTGDTFTINGTNVSAKIQNGDNPVSGFFKSGNWVWFTYDSTHAKINFISGGGSSTIPNYEGKLVVKVTTSDSGSLGSTQVRVRNEQLGSNYVQSLDALGSTTFSLIDNHTYYVVLLNYPSSYYGAAGTIAITGGVTQELDLELKTEPDIVGWRMRQDTGVIEYTDGAVDHTAMTMTNGIFDAGSWTNSWLTKMKPCLLKNGVVQYYLKNTGTFTYDYTKQTNDTASDITTGTDGNVMIEFPLIYYKFYEETDVNNVIWIGCKFSQTPQDDTWCANAFLNINGIIQSTMYMAAYDGYVNNNVLYSLSGKTPSNNITIGNFRIYATANGSGYQQQEWSKRVFLQSLFIMLFKSTDSQTALGKGVTGASAAISSGSMNDKGLFWGDQTGINGVKFCGIENFWGNIDKFCDGLILSSYVYKYKIYGLYNDTASGYLTGNTAPNTGSYIKVMYSNNGEGLVPKTNDTVSSYYYDYFSLSSGTNICYTGGRWSSGAIAGVFYASLHVAASSASTNIGASLSFTPV